MGLTALVLFVSFVGAAIAKLPTDSIGADTAIWCAALLGLNGASTFGLYLLRRKRQPLPSFDPIKPHVAFAGVTMASLGVLIGLTFAILGEDPAAQIAGPIIGFAMAGLGIALSLAYLRQAPGR